MASGIRYIKASMLFTKLANSMSGTRANHILLLQDSSASFQLTGYSHLKLLERYPFSLRFVVHLYLNAFYFAGSVIYLCLPNTFLTGSSLRSMVFAYDEKSFLWIISLLMINMCSSNSKLGLSYWCRSMVPFRISRLAHQLTQTACKWFFLHFTCTQFIKLFINLGKPAEIQPISYNCDIHSFVLSKESPKLTLNIFKIIRLSF